MKVFFKWRPHLNEACDQAPLWGNPGWHSAVLVYDGYCNNPHQTSLALLFLLVLATFIHTANMPPSLFAAINLFNLHRQHDLAQWHALHKALENSRSVQGNRANLVNQRTFFFFGGVDLFLNTLMFKWRRFGYLLVPTVTYLAIT